MTGVFRCLAYTLMKCLGFCVCFLVFVGHVHGDSTIDRKSEQYDSPQPKPCCLPYKFTAVLGPLSTFSAQKKQVMRVYRNWEARFQVQDTSTFSADGIEETLSRTIMDYNNMVMYSVIGDECQSRPINSGMLEPCMPENSQYLGKSYIGAFDNKADFDAWYFTRKDQNRNIEMTIVVTADKCVPIMEHITGTMGQGSTDTLVLFTNVTQEFDEGVFQIPISCLKSSPM